MNTIFLILALLLLITYNIIAVIKTHGIPNSLSSTSYLWEKKCDHHGLIHKAGFFTIFCFSMAILLFLPWILVTSEMFQFLVFISCAGLMIAGSTPFYRQEKVQKNIHWVGGVISLIAWAVWCIVETHYGILFDFIIAFGISLIFNRKNYTYWAENLSFLILIIWLLIGI